ncbi:hypothetical protein Si133o_01191 [Streptococcus infantarius subsp. infantarius]|nr:hypothetical protein [Streptococcus infantarius subsp. infantarius]
MTHLIIAVSVLAFSEVITLTLLGRKQEQVLYYQSEDYKKSVFTELAYRNSQKWSEANGK